MDAEFEAFIRERQYRTKVSPRTIQWYRESFNWLGTPPTDEPALKAFTVRMREAGLKPTSCNNRVHPVNAFLTIPDTKRLVNGRGINHFVS